MKIRSTTLSSIATVIGIFAIAQSSHLVTWALSTQSAESVVEPTLFLKQVIWSLWAILAIVLVFILGVATHCNGWNERYEVDLELRNRDK